MRFFLLISRKTGGIMTENHICVRFIFRISGFRENRVRKGRLHMHEKGGNLPLIKLRNNELVKKMIYQHSPISRSEIAQELHLTAPTITACVNPLVSAGLLQESVADTPVSDGRPLGRRPAMLEFVRDAYRLCGVELGPYRTYLVLTDLRGNTLRSQELERMPDDYDHAIALLSQWIGDFLKGEERILGVGVGLPGWVAGKAGTIYNSFRKGWNDKDLAGDLTRLLGIPVVMENNVRARLIGADLFDRRISRDPAVYFYASFGLACPIMMEGKVLYGLSAGAGEIGHTSVDPNGPHCAVCGKNGCLESVASEKAILRRCRALMETGVNTLLNALAPSPEELTIAHVLAAQECDDRAVNMVLNDAVRHLAVSLAGIINLISPETVLVDAHLMKSGRNQERMLEVLQENIYDLSIHHSEITFVPYDAFNGARFAAALAVKVLLLEANQE